MSLTIEQQKRLYDRLNEKIIELHSGELKPELAKFTEEYRAKGQKGIVLIDYINITNMISSVKNKSFFYEWVPRAEAEQLKHRGISSALMSMNATNDCVFVCSLTLSLKHLYINCVKLKDVHK